MNQATQISQRIETAAYCTMLQRVREQAKASQPGMHVSGLKIVGGMWYAVTSAGMVPVRELAAAFQSLPKESNVF